MKAEKYYAKTLLVIIIQINWVYNLGLWWQNKFVADMLHIYE